jgi:hypothetical protein
VVERAVVAAFDQTVDILPFPKRALMIQRKTETEVLAKTGF